MEAAGLAVGVVPLAIAALKCYKTGKQLTDVVRNRKRNIQALIRALESYHLYLELLLVWLLKSVNVYDETELHAPSQITSLMQNPETIEKMREFLGADPSPAFQTAIENGQRAVEKIVRNIDRLLPGNQSNALEAIKLRSSADIGMQFRKGIRLFLRKEEIDDQVNILDSSANDLNRLHSLSDSLHRQMNASSRSNASRKLAKSLHRVRSYADRLYIAISSSWSPNCHPAHEAKLILEDRIDEASSSKYLPKKQKQNFCFQVVFASDPSAESDTLWHESEIRVADDIEHNEHPDAGPSYCIPSPRTPIKVTFSTSPPKSVAQPVTTEVEDICLAISKARREQKKLQLYLHTQHRFHCNHIAILGVHSAPSQSTNTISLKALLSASAQAIDPSQKMPFNSRLLLALNLASTLLQLNATPWLATLWSKSTVCFLAPTPLQKHSQIDLTRPFITVKFDSGPRIVDRKKFPEARRVILELGIMLLELWHHTTFELHCAASGVTAGDDYFERVTWAQKWLETSAESGSLLPDYINFVARCIKCNFGNEISLNPTWESDDLVHGFITGVIEPLRNLCKGSRS